MKEAAEQTGLTWTEEADGYVRTSNQPGTGFTTNRIARQQPEKWRSRLTEEEILQIGAILERFPIRTWPHVQDAIERDPSRS
jgi:hypothetical protein